MDVPTLEKHGDRVSGQGRASEIRGRVADEGEECGGRREAVEGSGQQECPGSRVRREADIWPEAAGP